MEKDEFSFVNDTYCRFCDMPEAELEKHETNIVNVWYSFGLIGMDGIVETICRLGPDKWKEMVASYDNVGLSRCALILEHCFNDWEKRYSPDSTDYWLADTDVEILKEKFSKSERQYYDSEHEIVDCLATYIRANC